MVPVLWHGEVCPLVKPDRRFHRTLLSKGPVAPLSGQACARVRGGGMQTAHAPVDDTRKSRRKAIHQDVNIHEAKAPRNPRGGRSERGKRSAGGGRRRGHDGKHESSPGQLPELALLLGDHTCRSRILMQPSEDRHDEGRERLGIPQRRWVPLLLRDDRPAHPRPKTGVFATDGSNPDTTTSVS